MKKTTAFLFLLFSLKGFSQNYDEDVTIADSFFYKKNYEKAADAYAKAFWKIGGKARPDDRYNAAVAFGQIKNADTVIYYIDRLANRVKFYEIEKIEKEEAFNFLAKNENWLAVCEKIRKNGEKMNFPLMRELEKILVDDQSVRGNKSKDDETYARRQQEMDAQNLVKVEAILQKYGWLGQDIIGSNGNEALFLVIQHSTPAVMEKYLPIMKAAVLEKKAEATQLALLQDRVNMNQGKKQIYGSQLRSNSQNADGSENWFIYPIEDAQNVDKRRAEIGLRPIAEYMKSFGITWDLEAYIKAQEEEKK